MKILIINGPNLNLLGKREPEIYGNQTFEDFLKTLRSEFKDFEIDYKQSNHEGEIIDLLQSADSKYDNVVLNAAAYTHTSIAIADAIDAINTPVIEVHISNIFKRETFRHKSFISSVCIGSISGFGLNSYRLAILSIID